MEYKNITTQVCELAKQVGAYIQAEAEHFTAETVELKSMNQLVSHVDKTAEEKLVQGLHAIVSEAGFLTEEQTVATEQKEYTWVIDPLDGTTNFIHHLPVYSISLALLHKGNPVVGVIYEPNRDELFYAWQNGGAFLNGKPIRVKQNDKLSESLLATGFPYYDFEFMQQYMDTLQSFLRITRGMRRMGSAAVDLAYVACGRFDGFFEYGLSPWDVAAGIAIVREAGGEVSTFSGNGSPIFDQEIVAASQAIYPSFSAVIKKGFNR